MKIVLIALFALSSGRRVPDDSSGAPLTTSSDRSDTHPLHLTDHASFRSDMGSVLANELVVQPGWTMTLDLQERRKAFKPNMYDVSVTGYNGTAVNLVSIGTVSSIVNPTGFRSHQDFKDGNGSSISRMHWSVRPSWKTSARAYIAKPRQRSKGIYYTFEKLSLYGARKQGVRAGYMPQTYSVYRGKCAKKSHSECDGLVLQAVGQHKGFSFDFFLKKNGSQKRVAYMSRVHSHFGDTGQLVGRKDWIRLTVLPGADVLMLTQLVSFIDLCKNDAAPINAKLTRSDD